MANLRPILLKLIILGVILDLAISGILTYGFTQVNHTQTKLVHITQAARCWDRVLDEAVTQPTTNTEKAKLTSEAIHCSKFIP